MGGTEIQVWVGSAGHAPDDVDGPGSAVVRGFLGTAIVGEVIAEAVEDEAVAFGAVDEGLAGEGIGGNFSEEG